jgi:cell division initiation protein
MRGYSEEQVDVFLDEVADEFERLFQDNIELRERIQLLDEQVTGYENLKETLNNTLVSAQQQADATRANANKEGELILRDAEIKARGIVSETYSEKQRIQQSLIQLRQIEEDFRFKFRSLLEAHINLLAEDEVSEERGRFRGFVTDMEQQLVPSLPDDESPSRPTVQSSDAATEAEPTPLETAVVEPEPSETKVVEPEPSETKVLEPVPSETAVVSDREAVAVVSDEIDLSGYLARLPDPEVVPDESAGEASADEGSDDEPSSDVAKGSTVRRFLFGKRDKPESEELVERKDRNFEW